MGTPPPEPTPLNRASTGRIAAPIRIMHLGLGAFHRAHQAWYTERTNAIETDEAWGIAAFTGRRPDEADRLKPQDGLYTLITRAADRDTAEIVGSISAVHDGADAHSLLQYFAEPALSIVTITVTEAGYRRAPDGHLDQHDPDVSHDRDELNRTSSPDELQLKTMPGRLVAGLRHRRDNQPKGLAVMSCDNLSGNGRVLAQAVTELADSVEGELADWIRGNITFPNTMVDRITPRTIPADQQTAAELTGYLDHAPVVTEPFSEWVIEDAFPAGRPPWDRVGVQLVDDVEPYEQRKLLLLNGAHSLLAYLGPLRGHRTVADAIADPWCRNQVERWWDAATPLLTTFGADELARYRAELTKRFENPRIEHQLAQIAADGSLKLPVRLAPVLQASDNANIGALVLAGWLAHLRGRSGPINDPATDLIDAVRELSDSEAAAEVVIAVMGQPDPALAAAVETACRELVEP